MKPVRTIQLVARETGLSVHTIRAWEKRYGAVTPLRADHARRLYSVEDVARLTLLKAVTDAGHSIGQVARATTAELEILLHGTRRPQRSPAASRAETVEELIAEAIRVIRDLNAPALDRLLDRAAVELGSPAVLQKFIAPLTARVGALWRAGDLAIAHEHFMSAHVTTFLSNFARPFSDNLAAPHLVVATPSGQLHELGAIIVCAAARSHGWRTTYLGPSLPVEELAGSMRNLQPRAVGLSIVFPPDDEALRRDLRKLRELLPAETALIVGGRSAEAYETVLREIKAIVVENLEELYPVLEKLGRGQALR